MATNRTPNNRAAAPPRRPLYSPFRYPGGKSFLAPVIRTWMSDAPPDSRLVEPFAGGASTSLLVALEHLAARVAMTELDPKVAAVWRVILSDDGPRFAESVRTFDYSESAVRRLLGTEETATDLDLALRTLVRNRTAHGGCMAPGASLTRRGENGGGIASRAYPNTVAERILRIHAHRHTIAFEEGDGLACIERAADDARASFFIDPPYSASTRSAGRRLYTHWKLDHARLFELASQVAGRVLITYDDIAEVRDLAARFGLSYRRVPTQTNHGRTKDELLIGRDLTWVAEP